MKSVHGHPRLLTDAEVARILDWHQDVVAWQRLRDAVKTKRQLARELHVTPATLAAAIRRGDSERNTTIPKPTRGRKPALAETLLSTILDWHAEVLVVEAMRKTIWTQQDLALELGVAPATVAYAVAHGGEYKQASPEKRATELARRQRRLAKLRERGLM
ncbi:MAG: hypothetical protein ABI885_28250 [Gammaproteobacteria bacterium]